LDLAAGEVRFLGESWNTVHRDKAPGLRGRIGRVFDEPGWVSNLDVDENITLSQRYHTRRPEPEIHEEARQRAQELGLTELPQGRPAFVPRAELRRAEWVRAFMGDPKLIILERPTRDLPEEWAGPLLAQVQKARERGSAVLWIAGDQDDVDEIALKPTLKFAMQDAMMKPDIG
jgi:phospholipid/cholesterol/gamma-HCH transport system ATP-binding protein